MDNKKLHWITVAAGILLIGFVYFMGHRAGYTVARTDLDNATARKAAVRSIIKGGVISPEEMAWTDWYKTLAQMTDVINESNKVVSSSDLKNPETMDKCMEYMAEVQKLLKASQGPPGAEWYREGLIADAEKRMNAYRLMKEGLQTGSDSTYLEGVSAEEKAINERAELEKKYEQWLTQEGY